MPTLLLKSDERAVNLREYLQDDWALILSHPDDFAPPESTPTGYITRINADLQRAGVRVLATASGPSWLDELDDPVMTVSFDRYCDAHRTVLPWAERVICHHLEATKRPVVLIVDATLRCRATIHYRRAGYQAQCLSKLLELVSVLRSGSNHHASTATLNDVSLARSWISGQDLMNGLRTRLRGRLPEIEG